MSESAAQRTTDHQVIRKWVEARKGKPSTVAGTERGGQAAGLLRIDFPEAEPDQGLQEISWDEFFEKFDESNLAFLYQEQTADGRPSRFNKFVSRDE